MDRQCHSQNHRRFYFEHLFIDFYYSSHFFNYFHHFRIFTDALIEALANFGALCSFRKLSRFWSLVLISSYRAPFGALCSSTLETRTRAPLYLTRYLTHIQDTDSQISSGSKPNSNGYNVRFGPDTKPDPSEYSEAKQQQMAMMQQMMHDQVAYFRGIDLFGALTTFGPLASFGESSNIRFS